MGIIIGEVLCLLLVFHLNKASIIPPRIQRDSTGRDPIVNAGQDYSLTCEGSEPLEWSYPEVPEDKRGWTSFHTTTNNGATSDFAFRSILKITNMSYPFVGFYSCQYAGLFGEKDQIYLYVNDTDNLSVDGNDKFSLHYATQYQDTTIPCRPTAPDIAVELSRTSTDEKIDFVYDPKVGFTFTVDDISFDDTYTCSFSRQTDKIVENTYTVQVVPPRSFLATPYIEDLSRNHTEIGETLTLICYLQEDSKSIRFTWKTPRGHFHADDHNSQKVIVKRPESHHQMGKAYRKSTIIVNNSKLDDTGRYSCEVSDRQGNLEDTTVFVKIRDELECSIDIREQNDQANLIVDAGDSAQWILDVMAHPIPQLTWFDNGGKTIKNSTNYYIDYSNDKAVFTIRNVSLENDGVYKIHGVSQRYRETRSCPQQKDFELSLTVYDAPSVCLISNGECTENSKQPPKIYMLDEEVDLECIAKGNPSPVITWEVAPQCADITKCDFFKVAGLTGDPLDRFLVRSDLRLDTSKEAVVKCIASNSLGNAESILTYFISDVKDGFEVFGFGLEAIVSKGEEVTEVVIAENTTLTFTCGVCPRKSEVLEVFLNGQLLTENDERFSLNMVRSNMSSKVTVTLLKADLSDSGTYVCRIRNLHDNSFEYHNITYVVKEPERPLIWDSNLNNEILVDYPNMKYTLFCNISGIPKPTIEWYKEETLIVPSRRLIFEDDSVILRFNNTQVTDEGIYRCEALNSEGRAFQQASLRFKVKPVSVAIYYYITGVIALLLLCAIVFILIRMKKERELRRELKLLGLENFHNGNPENLNPELGIDDQAELLPYNKKWEFPIENLKMGKQLGSGAFGVVMKAEARGIIEGQTTTTVAVKMVKKNADQSYIRALASELKIMAHLGKHINVVNLLGACTKNVAKRELLVIVEFCRFGNLQNYLYKHRESYINQVNPINGTIDYNIGADILERSYSISSENGSRPQSLHEYRDRRNTAMSRMHSTAGDETVILSNNSIQPEWRLNYKGDYRGDVKPISTRDLITWSFQIARGMEYLASRKVLHGDLAARNILLTENNIVKICDFGLAKTMYNDNNYKKKGNNPMPVKWMAIESIRDRIFSTQSDVWSFGIVLWEIFSLARTPYPGMEADERLYYKLVEGYRMESPLYAPKEMYKIMLDCWNTKPLARPSFTKLAEVIGILLEDSVRKHYVDLNNPYMQMNIAKSEENDYLGMLTPPSFDALSTPAPRYMNAEMFELKDDPHRGTPESSERYTFMGNNKEIFSPRLSTSEDVFSFPNGRKKDSNNMMSSQELKPMLHSNSGESDSESAYLTPITPVNSVANPSYNCMPTIPHCEDKDSEVKKIKDNYITMPGYKDLLNKSAKDVAAMGSSKANNAYYVNNDADMWNSVDV